MTLTLQLTALSTYLAFIWGVTRIFRIVEGNDPLPFKILKWLSLLFMGAFLFGMYQYEYRSTEEASVAFFLFGYAHLFFWWAMSTAKRKTLSVAFSTDTPEVLISKGPYRWVRHPFYSSYLASYLGSAIAAGFFPYGILFFCLFGFYFWGTQLEETKFSKSQLSNSYQAYRKRTGRFTPLKTFFCFFCKPTA